MSYDFATRLQRAVYDRLSLDADLMTAISSRVYDFVPENTPFPYIAFSSEFRDFSTHTFDGVESSIQVDVWSQKTGSKEANDIIGHVYDALHNISLSVTNYKTVLLMFDFSDIIKDVDGKTHHGIIRFRCILTETT